MTLLNTWLNNSTNTPPIQTPIGIQIGSSLACLPIIVLTLYLIIQPLVSIWRRIKKQTTGIEVNKSDIDSQSIGALIAQKYIHDTDTETIETPNPTSVEFEDIFTQLMEDALNKENRQLIIALDNLDRVSANDAKAILSALQTFLQRSEHHPPEWFKKLYILIPYDKQGLQRLWENGSSDSVASAFIDKTFQLRFEVPPLLLSDWHSYLMSLLIKALPDYDSGEFHATYRVFAVEGARSKMLFTPRELKILVNQIGAINRQWKNTYPLPQVAYYVFLRRRGVDVPNKLLEHGFPPDDLITLLGDSVEDNLSALAYNTSVEHARQILLQPLIVTALSERNIKEIRRLQQMTGFWNIVQNIPFRHWLDGEETKLAYTAYCIEQLEIGNSEKPLVEVVIKSLQQACSNVTQWDDFTIDTAEGLVSLLRLTSDINLAEQIIKRLPPLERIRESEEEVKALRWVAALVYLLNNVKIMGYEEIYETGITVEATPAGYIYICNALYQQDKTREFWLYVKPSKEYAVISTEIINIIAQNSLTDIHVHAIKVMKVSNVINNWNAIGTQLADNLRIVDQKPPDRIRALLTAIWELHDDTNIDARINNLATQGHLLHHLHFAKTDPVAVAWCIYLFLRSVPDASPPNHVGNSTNGFNFLNAHILTTPDNHNEEVEEFITIIQQVQDYELLFTVLDQAKSSKAFILKCLKKLLTTPNILDVFTVEVILARWQFLLEEFTEDQIRNLFSLLIKKTQIIDNICVGEFDQSRIKLYSLITINGGAENPKFQQWCQEGLGAVTTQLWVSQLKSVGAKVHLLLDLLENGVSIKLGTNYQEALAEHGKSLVTDNRVTVNIPTERWNILLEPLAEETRNLLRSRLIMFAGQAEGKIRPEFFRIYGKEISHRKTLDEENNIVLQLFIPVVKLQNEKGLEWVANILTEYPDILNDKIPTHVDGFKTYVKEAVDSTEKEQLNEVMILIANHIGVDIPENRE